VVVSLVTIVVASEYAKEGLVFDKDWEKEITQKTVDIRLYGSLHPIIDDKKAMISFLRTANLTYMWKLIHSFLLNMVMPRLGPRDEIYFACIKSW